MMAAPTAHFATSSALSNSIFLLQEGFGISCSRQTTFYSKVGVKLSTRRAAFDDDATNRIVFFFPRNRFGKSRCKQSEGDIFHPTVRASASGMGEGEREGERGGTIVREVLESRGRAKIDYRSDQEFYSFPRLVKHVDDKFLQTLTNLYRERVPANGRVLDLMSSWVSHLPEEVRYELVVGHGMNAAELKRNPRLDEFFIKNLNEDQKFAFKDQSFDAVICTVSVQYLEQPEKVFAEIYRILRPGGVCIISFSNRMFYDKAVAAWRDTSGYGRIQLVRQYFQCVRGFTEPEIVKEVFPSRGESISKGGPNPIQSIFKFFSNFGKLFQRAAEDPFYAVVSYRNFRPLRD